MMYNYKSQFGNRSTAKFSLITVFSVFLLFSFFLFHEASSKDSESSSSLFSTGSLLLIFLIVFLILTFLVITENPIVEFLINNYKLTIIASVFLFLLILFVSTDTFKSITGFMSVFEPIKTVPKITEDTQKSEFPPDTINSIKITESMVALTEIDVEVYNKANNVKIDVSRLEDKPNYVIKDVSGVVYQYIKVEKTNLKDDNIKEVKIKFSIEKSWMTNNDIDKSTISLYRYQDDTWIKLSTYIVGEDVNNVNYEVDTGKLSLFAIAGESKSTEKTISTTTTVNVSITTTTGMIASTTTTETTTTTITSTTIIFERNLDCQKCGQHKAPPLTEVKMTITATVSKPIQNTRLIDYYPSEWTVTDTNGGTTSVFNSTYKKIEWDINSVSGSVSRWYFIKSPQRTLPPTKYYFFSEMENQKSDAWFVVVSDPTKDLTISYSCNDANIKCTNTTVTISNPDGSAMTVNYQKPVNFFNVTSGQYECVNRTIKSQSLTISGRDYSFGVNKGFYQAYFRDISSDVKDRPMAMSKDNYTLTFSPQNYILYVPHKATTEGRVGNKQKSSALVSEDQVSYPNQYAKVGTSGDFANLTYKYQYDQIKEELVVWDQDYLRNRFQSQCNEGDANIVNLVFQNIVRAYHSGDVDSQTMGVFYGSDRVKFKDFGLAANDEKTTSEEIYFTDENNNTVYYIPILYAHDSNGSQILLNKTISMTNFGNLRVDILTPFSWLNSSERVYPITIDPTTKLVYNTTIDYYSINNTLNGYYFNATNAEQRIDDIQNYWAKNDVCIGLYFGNRWHEFCGDSLDWVWYNSTNFKTYMNLTGTAELKYAGYTVDVNVEYYLGQDYPEVLGTVTLENTGNKDISDSYLKIKTHDIRVNLTYDNNTFRVNTTSFWEAWSGWKEYLLDQSGLDLFYTENNLASRKYSIFDNSTESWVELNWNNSYWKNGIGNSMNYNLTVKKGSEINAPIDLVLLTGNVNKNDVITTNFKWADAIKQNFTENYEIYQNKTIEYGAIIKDSYENGTQYYLTDTNMTIEMSSNKIARVSSKKFKQLDMFKAASLFTGIASRFDCFSYRISGGNDVVYCPENQTSDKEITFLRAKEELTLPERNANYSYTIPYLLVKDQTGVLENLDYTFTINNINYNSSSFEDMFYRIGRTKLHSIFNFDLEGWAFDIDVNFSNVDASSYCIKFPLPRFANLTVNVTLPIGIKNYTFGRNEFIIENYTIGTSAIARIKPYPCCDIIGVTLQSAQVCSV